MSICRTSRRALDVVGPQRLLFGTDSSYFPRGWNYAIFEAQTAGSHAWRVTREAGELRWADDQGVTSREPQTSFAQRMQAWFARILRIDAQL